MAKTFSKIPSADELSREVQCPVCFGSAFKKPRLVGTSRFVTCAGCGMVIQNPRPVREALAARYDSEYFQYEIDNGEAFFKLMMLGLDDASFFTEIDPALPGPKAILDVGCATGRLLNHFKGLGWRTAGAELCIDSVNYGNREYDVDIRAASLEDAGFSDASFSVVHASHLIEHVDDPMKFVSEVFRVLMPGGVFICVTPATDGLQARLFGTAWRSLIEDHVALFNKNNLRQLLQDGGFEVETVKTWGGLAVGTAPLWLKRPIDKAAKRFGFGDVVLMTARKSA